MDASPVDVSVHVVTAARHHLQAKVHVCIWAQIVDRCCESTVGRSRVATAQDRRRHAPRRPRGLALRGAPEEQPQPPLHGSSGPAARAERSAFLPLCCAAPSRRGQGREQRVARAQIRGLRTSLRDFRTRTRRAFSIFAPVLCGAISERAGSGTSRKSGVCEQDSLGIYRDL